MLVLLTRHAKYLFLLLQLAQDLRDRPTSHAHCIGELGRRHVRPPLDLANRDPFG